MGKSKKFNKYCINEDGTCEFYIDSSKGYFVVYVDREDLERLIKLDKSWSFFERDGSNYARTNIYGRDDTGKYKLLNTPVLHRWILGIPIHDNRKIDHINNNGLDDRKSNLRITDDKRNGRNRKSKNMNNTSGYRNVQWDKKRNKWSVILQINNKAKRMGSFEDINIAGKYAEEMRLKYYGEYAGQG